MTKNKKEIFRGVGTALITPFKDGKIDLKALSALIERQITAGVDALIIGGTTGEAATLSREERYSLFKFSKECVGGRVRLVFGTGTNDTKVATEHTEVAEKIGCDGILSVTPYYNKGTEEGVYQHYAQIAKSTNLPIILYNVPSRTGVNLGLNLLERLSEIPNVVALKEAGDSVDRLVALSAFGDRLALYSGNDSQIYPTLALGGLGVISVVSNLYPKEVCELCGSYFSGDLDGALKLQHTLLGFIRAAFLETNPAPIKYAMSLSGLCTEELRLPLAPPRESTRCAIREEIKKLSEVLKNP